MTLLVILTSTILYYPDFIVILQGDSKELKSKLTQPSSESR